MAVKYISQTGGGSGTFASPMTMAAFIALPPAAGDIAYMLDGTYTGANSMITPTGINGAESNHITVAALNEGMVRINGEGARTPILLNNCDHWTIQGVNVHNSNQPTIYVPNSASCILRRICAWDAAAGNNHVFSLDTSSSCLVEDCAAWGVGRKMFEAYNGSNNTFRRCWGRWTANTAAFGGGPVFEMSYASTGTTVENCIGSWARTGTAPSGPAGIFGWTGSTSGNDDSKLYGSIAYVRGLDSVDTHLILSSSGGGYVDVDMLHVASYVQPGFHATFRPFSMNDASSGMSATNITSVGGAADVFGNWTLTNHNDQSSGTISLWTGTGATIGYRYVDRVLTTVPLWPWPMDARIKAALITSGYPAVTASFLNNTGYVTDAIQEMFGAIPSPYYLGASGSNRFLVASDSFTGTSLTALGGNWQQLNAAECTMYRNESGRLTASPAITDDLGAARWVAHTFANDQYASLVFHSLTAPGPSSIGVAARCSADTNGAHDMYYVLLYTDSGTTYISLSKFIDGIPTGLSARSDVTWAAGDRVEIECEGTTIRALKSGVVLMSVVDTSLTTGQPGVVGTGAADAQGDDWEGGNLNEAPTETSVPAQKGRRFVYMKVKG